MPATASSAATAVTLDRIPGEAVHTSFQRLKHRHVAVMYIQPKGEASGAGAQRVVRRIRDIPEPFEHEVGGPAATFVDLKATMTSNLLVVLLILTVTTALVGVPAYRFGGVAAQDSADEHAHGRSRARGFGAGVPERRPTLAAQVREPRLDLRRPTSAAGRARMGSVNRLRRIPARPHPGDPRGRRQQPSTRSRWAWSAPDASPPPQRFYCAWRSVRWSAPASPTRASSCSPWWRRC